MKRIKNAVYRTVNYYGSRLRIPAHHCYLATDENGFAYSFSECPDFQGGFWVHRNDRDPHSIQYIALFDLGAVQPEKTLSEFPRITDSLI